jgi:hypothetical protein
MAQQAAAGKAAARAERTAADGKRTCSNVLGRRRAARSLPQELHIFTMDSRCLLSSSCVQTRQIAKRGPQAGAASQTGGA